jgi:energy-coupling factor transport system ATP-binding protein
MEIKFKNVKCEYIFNNINIDIKENEITAIIGKNGSGKTTFMDLIFGINNDFDGEIIVDKTVISRKARKKTILKARESIGYIRQNNEKDLFNINALEDIKYGLSNLDTKKLEEQLSAFNLDDRILYRCYSDLSGGEKKKILVIKQLIRDSKILMFDDITKDLDSKSISTLIKILKREKRNGKIIIISSMDSDFLLRIADSFIILDNGKVINSIDKYNIFTDTQILDRVGMSVPSVLDFKMKANLKKIKLMYRDNIDDLIKDVYRNAEK